MMEEDVADMETVNVISDDVITSGLNYAQYRERIEKLLQEGKATGIKQTPARVEFTRLNIHRMNRLDKTTALFVPLAMKAATMPAKQIWVLLAEGWCGDCAQIVPVIAKIAAISNGQIDLRIINPAEHSGVMDAYLTNGTRSIPKLIILSADTRQELATWGPRPNSGQLIMHNWKNGDAGVSWEEFEKVLHTWYAKDRTISTQKELTNLPSWHI